MSREVLRYSAEQMLWYGIDSRLSRNVSAVPAATEVSCNPYSHAEGCSTPHQLQLLEQEPHPAINR